ncbi:hypothetical protein GALL_411870 [mine drainage metagenome]|uniref:Uncharacterized protein n=1 Tax=mine drainage metagenome TaxID=410659 RepID=A0A1J5QAW3_9ZZZZ
MACCGSGARPKAKVKHLPMPLARPAAGKSCARSPACPGCCCFPCPARPLSPLGCGVLQGPCPARPAACSAMHLGGRRTLCWATPAARSCCSRCSCSPSAGSAIFPGRMLRNGLGAGSRGCGPGNANVAIGRTMRWQASRPCRSAKRKSNCSGRMWKSGKCWRRC